MGDVYVDDELIFKAGATHQANIVGNPSTKRMCSVDWFDQKALNTTRDYTTTLDGDSDAIALTAGGYCGITVATGTTDNNVCFLCSPLIFDISYEPEIETRINIADVSGTFVFFGFGDSTTESTPHSSIDYDGGSALAAAAADAVGFVIDADGATGGESYIICCSVNTSGTVQYVDLTPEETWADGESFTLRVKLDTSGNARFWIDGIEVGYIALAVADVPLSATWNFGTRANDNTNAVYVRYLKKWQTIP